jgi:hypothetical protein
MQFGRRPVGKSFCPFFYTTAHRVLIVQQPLKILIINLKIRFLGFRQLPSEIFPQVDIHVPHFPKTELPEFFSDLQDSTTLFLSFLMVPGEVDRRLA